MTVKDLIKKLQFAIDELDFVPYLQIHVDVFDSNYYLMTYWNIEIDDTAISEPRCLCIIVYEETED